MYTKHGHKLRFSAARFAGLKPPAQYYGSAPRWPLARLPCTEAGTLRSPAESPLNKTAIGLRVQYRINPKGGVLTVRLSLTVSKQMAGL